MSVICNCESVITIEDVKACAPTVFKMVKDSVGHVSNVCEIIGIDTNGESVSDIINSFDFTEGEYDESYLEDEKFHMLIIKYILSARVIKSANISIYDVISVSKMIKSIIGEGSEESISVDAKMIQSFNISANALPPAYRVSVEKDIIEVSCHIIMYEYLNEIFPEGPGGFNYSNFENYDDFKQFMDGHAKCIISRIEDTGNFIPNSKLFTHVLISHLFSMGNVIGIGTCSEVDIDDKINVINECHKTMFEIKSNKEVDQEELVKAIVKMTLLAKNVDAGNFKIIGMDGEEDGEEDL